MNFVFIAVGIFSSRSVTGGDTILTELTKRLMRQGNHVAILTSKSGEMMFRGQGVDADFWTITEDERTSEANLARAIPALLIRMFKAGMLLRKKNLSQKTIIFSATDLFFDIFPTLFVRDRRIKRVLSFHLIQPNPFKGWRGILGNKLKVPQARETIAYLQQILSLLCLKYCCDLIFSLFYVQYFLVNKGIPQQKIVGFSPGIDWDAINNATAQGKRYDACWTGRYHPMKGCDDLIGIWELVYQERSEAKLAIMGSAVRELEPLVRKKHLEENIEFLGFVDDETKFRTMKESKVLLFPSYYAGGMVIDEAMACGLPVIVYDLPGYQGIYPKGMVKVSIGDREAFASETIRLLTEEELRERLSTEAEEVASHWSWDKVLEDFLAGINKLTKSEKAAS
jgi:glycosyltransferase involved in cell wall biosynthesis